jgi:hypothetical protein
MRDWLETIHAVDERVTYAIEEGLHELRHESRFAVTDSFDMGVSAWRP